MKASVRFKIEKYEMRIKLRKNKIFQKRKMQQDCRHRGLSNGTSYAGIFGHLHAFFAAFVENCTELYGSQERVKYEWHFFFMKQNVFH